MRPRKPTWFEAKKRWKTKIGGKVVYFPKEIGRKDVGAAWQHLQALEAKLDAPLPSSADLLVETVAELYLASCEAASRAGELSTGQFLGHQSQLRLFVAGPVASLRVRELTPEVMDEFFAGLRPRRSAHYVANVGKSIRAMLNWAARPVSGRQPSRLIPSNPLDGYRFPRPPGAVRGYVDPRITRRFIRWCWAQARTKPPQSVNRRFDRLYLLMLQFMRLTGCRPGEACGLRWSDVEWEAKRITIPPERHKTGRKTGKDRRIWMTPPVERLLRTIERLPDRHSMHVFTHKRGNFAKDRGQESAVAGEPWPSGSAAAARMRMLRTAAIEAGLKGVSDKGPLKLIAYAARHAYVSNAVSSGLTTEQTAGLVGNTPQVVSRTYAHAVEDQDRARAEKLVRRGGG